MNIIGKNIKRLRQAAGFNQATVAYELGISIPAFSKIETGITDPNFSRTQQIADFFKVGLDTLTYEVGEAPASKLSDTYLDMATELEEAKSEIIRLQSKVIDLYEKLDSK